VLDTLKRYTDISLIFCLLTPQQLIAAFVQDPFRAQHSGTCLWSNNSGGGDWKDCGERLTWAKICEIPFQPVNKAGHGIINRRIMVQVGIGIKLRPIWKIWRTKRARSIAQVVECLPVKHKALSSNPGTTGKKKSGLINLDTFHLKKHMMTDLSMRKRN
jgi:hypothetical protein